MNMWHAASIFIYLHPRKEIRSEIFLWGFLPFHPIPRANSVVSGDCGLIKVPMIYLFQLMNLLDYCCKYNNQRDYFEYSAGTTA